MKRSPAKKHRPPKHTPEEPLLEWWSNEDKEATVPEGQVDVKRRWKAATMFLDEQNVVHEYELIVDRGVRLTGILDLVVQEVRRFDEFDPQAFGFKVW